MNRRSFLAVFVALLVLIPTIASAASVAGSP